MGLKPMRAAPGNNAVFGSGATMLSKIRMESTEPLPNSMNSPTKEGRDVLGEDAKRQEMQGPYQMEAVVHAGVSRDLSRADREASLGHMKWCSH